MKVKVGVLYGGSSTEHDISIITALQVMNNLDLNKYDIIPLYLTKDNELLSSKKLFNIDIYKQEINKKGLNILYTEIKG